MCMICMVEIKYCRTFVMFDLVKRIAYWTCAYKITEKMHTKQLNSY